MRDQLCCWHFHDDAGGRNAAQRRARHASVEEHRYIFVRVSRELFVTDGPRDHGRGDPVPTRSPLDFRIFGVFGVIADRIHCVLHVNDGAWHIPVGLEFQLHLALAFFRLRRCFFDTVNGDQSRLQQLDDAFIDIVGARPVPIGPNRDGVIHHIRKELGAHVGGRRQSKQDQEHKE